MSTCKDGPVLIDLDDAEVADPAAAPPVPDLAAQATTGQAMQTMAALAARKPSRLARWFWSALVALVGFVASVTAYDFVMGLLDRNPVLGLTALILIGFFCVILLAIAVKELAAFGRLKKLDTIHADAQEAMASDDLKAARKVTGEIVALYKARPETEWGRARIAERQGDVFDADGLLGLVETDLLDPLDKAARREVEEMMAPLGKNVRFLGELDQEGLTRQYERASLLFWPGVNEAFGMTYLEAQAAGVPVVAQDRPGVRDVILPDKHPRPFEGPEALAKRLLHLLLQPETSAEEAADGRARMQRHHLLHAAAKTLAEGLESFA